MSSEYSKLETLAKRFKLLENGEHGLAKSRLSAEKDKTICAMHRVLRPVVNKMLASKNMKESREEAEQHAYIAIIKAVRSWDPTIATYSTHVNWQLQAELQALQHAHHPERRKVKVMYPVQFVEMDKIYHCSESGDNITLKEVIVSEGAEERTLKNAVDFMALRRLDRELSHYVGSKVARSAKKVKIETEMRNRDIYILNRVKLHTHESIGFMLGLTRERIRQIVGQVEKYLRPYVPTLETEAETKLKAKAEEKVEAKNKPKAKSNSKSKADESVMATTKAREITVPTKQAHADYHSDWEFLVTEYAVKTGIDCRLHQYGEKIGAKEAQRYLEASIRFTPVIASHNRKLPPEIEFEIREGFLVEPIQTNLFNDEIATNIVPISRGISKKAVAMGLTALALATGFSAAANAQTSRALPPETAIVETTVSEVPAVPQINRKSVVTRHAMSGAKASSGVSGPLQEMEKIKTNRPAWAVATATYADYKSASASWNAERSSWAWLKGLYPGFMGNRAAGKVKVAFGPLDKNQAGGLCREAGRIGKPCEVVPFGKVKMANANPNAGSSSKVVKRSVGKS